MSMERILNQMLRRLMRQTVNRAVDGGMRQMGGAKAVRQGKAARKALRQAKRLSRM